LEREPAGIISDKSEVGRLKAEKRIRIERRK
jgi:hypothetical protein